MSAANVSRREAIEIFGLIGAAASGVGAEACGSSDSAGASTDAKAPYPTWNATTTNDYVRTLPDGTTARYVTRRGEDVTVGGTPFGRYTMQKDGGSGTTSAEIWVNREGGQKVTLAGASYTSDTAVALGLPRGGSVTAQTPLTLDLGAPLGVAQPFQTKVTAGVSTTTQTADFDVQGSFTVVEKDVSVETPSGTVHGCSRVKVEGGVPLLFGVNIVSASGELWMSPSLGVVKAVLDDPLDGFGMSSDSTRGWHDLGNGYASVEAVGVVGGGVRTFELSTTEASGGQYDADKETHAKLYVELRWVDEAAAKTDAKPYVDVELGTMLGVFPFSLERSRVSLFHPDENGKGYVTWVGYANEAAKNEPGGNGIAYSTTVKAEAGMSPLRVSSRIVFKRVGAAS